MRFHVPAAACLDEEVFVCMPVHLFQFATQICVCMSWLVNDKRVCGHAYVL